MSRLIIAEKPSVARDLARVLGVTGRGRGFIQGGDWLITWCVGHLVELVEPAAYNDDWRRWSLQSLPMSPPTFKLQAVEKTQDQYEVVKRLLLRKDVTAVINACDAGREGELIFRYVYTLSGCQVPIKRLWISSMTDEAIQEGMANLKPGLDYDRLWDAARCRSEADWLVGLNATRAITVMVRQALGPGGGGPLFSVGRVQTPTLALVVRREWEIEHFIPQDYWLLDAYFKTEAGEYKGRWFKGKSEKFEKHEDALALQERLAGCMGVVSKVEKKKAKEKPPFLFDLTTLQRVANKRFGLSAADTLKIAQSLYESHKALTYPRTDSSFLSQDMYKELPRVMRSLDGESYGEYIAFLREQGKLPKTKRVFDDKKVTDHHAIIPTPKRPNFGRFSQQERQVYDLVVRRFLAAFYPDAQFEKTTIVTKVEGQQFRTRGKVVLDPGWRRLDGWTMAGPPKRKKSTQKDDNETDAVLPPVSKGQAAETLKLEILTKQTKPPSRYTEATLLAAMEGAGKSLEDSELKAAMKDSGLGTPATRAGIIETLLYRRYIQRAGKSLKPLSKGDQLIKVLPVEDLMSAQLTGEWEARLARMARGEAENAQSFRQDVDIYLQEMMAKMKTAPLKQLAAAALESIPQSPKKKKGKKGKAKAVPNAMATCPRCEGGVMDLPKVYACRGESGEDHGCGLVLFKTVARRPLAKEEALALLTAGHTELLTGFISRKDKNFDAKLKLTDEGRVVFDFPPRERSMPSRVAPARARLGPCPSCGKGEVIRGNRAYGCNGWKAGCTFRVPLEIDEEPVPPEVLAQLLADTQKEIPAPSKDGFIWAMAKDGEGLQIQLKAVAP